MPRRRTAALLLSATGLGVTVCACSPQPAPPPPHPAAPGASPEQVCSALAREAYTATPNREPTPAEARTRAAEHWGTPALQQQWRGSGADPLWQQLATTGGTLHAETAPIADQAPPARGPHAAAAVQVTPIATWPTGQQSPQPAVILYCGLDHGPQGWRVSSVQVSGA